MPSVPKHIEISKKRTGKSYQEVHEWIDDPDQKNERHDITRVLEFSRMFRENMVRRRPGSIFSTWPTI